MTVYLTPTGPRFVSDQTDPFRTRSTVQTTPGLSIPLTGNLTAAYDQLYRSQPWVWIVVNKIARGISRLPLKVYLRDEANDSRERVRTTDLAQLIRRPQPRRSTRSLVEAWVGSTAVYGNALTAKIRPSAGSTPSALVPLDWRRVTAIADGDSNEIIAWRYQMRSGGHLTLLPSECIHFAWWGPDGLGISPLEPLRMTLLAEDAAQRYSASSFDSGVRPSGALVTEADLTAQQRADLRTEIQDAYAGPDKAGRLLLLDGGLKWESIQQSAADAQLIEHRRLARDEVAAVYDVPPPAVQILDRATFSNVTEQHRMLYQDTYGPWMGLIEQELDAQLIDEEPAYDGEFLEFETGEVLRPDLKARSEAYAKLLAVLTPNEVRALENRPAIKSPYADAVYLPLANRPIGEDIPEDVQAGRAAPTAPAPSADPAADPTDPAQDASGDPDTVGAASDTAEGA